MEELKNLAARIDTFSVRERGLIMLTVLVLLYIVWQVWLMTPLEQQETLLSQRILDTHTEIQKLNRQVSLIVKRKSDDPDARSRQELARLQAELETLEAELREMTVHLIPPRKWRRCWRTFWLVAVGCGFWV